MSWTPLDMIFDICWALTSEPEKLHMCLYFHRAIYNFRLEIVWEIFKK